MSDRLVCIVPDCSRTIGVTPEERRAARGSLEWICGTHWRRLTSLEKRIFFRRRRREKRLGFDPSPDASSRIWAALKRRAAQ